MSDILLNDIEIPIEYDDIIEFQLDDFVFLQYSKKNCEYYVQHINSELEEEILLVTDQDFPIHLKSITITIDDFLYFTDLTI